MSKTITYQHCRLDHYEDNPKALRREFFCFEELPGGNLERFRFNSTQIDSIIYGSYDMGHCKHTYIRLKDEYQLYHLHYIDFDSDFDQFICSSDESQSKQLKLLQSRYPNANITIIDDGALRVWFNCIVDVMRTK